MVYDILPYTNAWWFPVSNYRRIYYQWVRIILKLDLVFTISKTVKLKIKREFRLRNTDHIIPIKLGANFKKKIEYPKITSKKNKKPKQNEEVRFLMVGTLEPRKGHLNVLEGFAHLVDKLKINARLDIVGNLGWDYDKILKFLNSSELYETKIFLHTSVNDKQLQYFYNKKVIARNIEVFREVGKNKVFYFPKNSSPKILARFLKKWINKNYKKSTNYGKINFTTWSQTSQEIEKKLLKL